MNFVDQILVRLSNAAERNSIFSNKSLENILNAAYETDRLPVNGPYTAVYDEFIFGYADFNVSQGEGRLSNYNNNEFTDVALRFTDIVRSNDDFADILWRGAIVGRSAPGESVVDQVKMQWKLLGRVDESVIANLGALPTDDIALENERKSQFITILKENLVDDSIISEEFLDELLQQYQVKTVSELLQKSGEVSPATVAVRFSDATGLPATSQLYPISGIIIICEEDFSIRDKLVSTKLLRKRMERTGIEKSEEKSLYPKKSLVIIWIVDAEIFDDQHWPGGDAGMSATQRRNARKDLAEKWLAKEGIGLVAVTKN